LTNVGFAHNPIPKTVILANAGIQQCGDVTVHTYWIPPFGPVDLVAGPYLSEGKAGSVILANAGIQKRGVVNLGSALDSRDRGNDIVGYPYRMVGLDRPLHTKSTGPFAGMTTRYLVFLWALLMAKALNRPHTRPERMNHVMISTKQSRSGTSLVPLCLMAALVMAYGWGYRGIVGHEGGAMVPGALLGMAICLASGRGDWYRRTAVAGLFGAVGWAWGGSMSYMEPPSA
jgi:hypothetical protein